MLCVERQRAFQIIWMRKQARGAREIGRKPQTLDTYSHKPVSGGENECTEVRSWNWQVLGRGRPQVCPAPDSGFSPLGRTVRRVTAG